MTYFNIIPLWSIIYFLCILNSCIYVSFVIFLIGSSDSLSTVMFVSFFHWFYISSLSCMSHKNFISFCCLPLNLKMIYDTIHPIPIDLKCYWCYILIYWDIYTHTLRSVYEHLKITINLFLYLCSIFKLFWFISMLFLLLLWLLTLLYW